MYHVFPTHSLTDGHLGYSLVLPLVNTSSMETDEQVVVQSPLSICPREIELNHADRYILIFDEPPF